MIKVTFTIDLDFFLKNTVESVLNDPSEGRITYYVSKRRMESFSHGATVE